MKGRVSMSETAHPLPVADGPVGLEILKGLARERSLLCLTLMHRYVGRCLPDHAAAFPAGGVCRTRVQPSDPGLRPAEAALASRNRPRDSPPAPRRVPVVDGDEHDRLRSWSRRCSGRVVQHIPAFRRYTDQVIETWRDGETRDMLVEMRRIALLILTGAAFEVDFTPDMDRLWHSILKRAGVHLAGTVDLLVRHAEAEVPAGDRGDG